jgi:hypothetical protein
LEGHAGQRRKSRKVGQCMACRAEWEEFGTAGLGRKAGMQGTDTKGKKRENRTGRTGHSRKGQDRTGVERTPGKAW